MAYPEVADDDLVLAGPVGDPLYAETISRSSKELVEKLGLPVDGRGMTTAPDHVCAGQGL